LKKNSKRGTAAPRRETNSTCRKGHDTVNPQGKSHGEYRDGKENVAWGKQRTEKGAKKKRTRGSDARRVYSPKLSRAKLVCRLSGGSHKKKKLASSKLYPTGRAGDVC